MEFPQLSDGWHMMTTTTYRKHKIEVTTQWETVSKEIGSMIKYHYVIWTLPLRALKWKMKQCFSVLSHFIFWFYSILQIFSNLCLFYNVAKMYNEEWTF